MKAVASAYVVRVAKPGNCLFQLRLYLCTITGRCQGKGGPPKLQLVAFFISTRAAFFRILIIFSPKIQCPAREVHYEIAYDDCGVCLVSSQWLCGLHLRPIPVQRLSLQLLRVRAFLLPLQLPAVLLLIRSIGLSGLPVPLSQGTSSTRWLAPAWQTLRSFLLDIGPHVVNSPGNFHGHA